MPRRRSKSSGRWTAEHLRDPYVRRARQEGARSRAVYKLEELDRRYGLIRPGAICVDLGAAPGGWSQYAAERLAGRGRVIAVDLLPLAPLPGVEFIQGDFTAPATLERLQASLGGARVMLVMSDMAPNITGVATIDQARSIELAELALAFATTRLHATGSLLIKLFQGEGYEAYLRGVREEFTAVRTIKPKASRARSREMYLLARNLRI